MKNYSKDLHRKGELNKVEAMELLANKLIKGYDMGTAFVTEGMKGYDAFCIIANKTGLTNKEGFVLFNEKTNKAEFIKDLEE